MIKLFERYLLDFRIRLAHKKSLVALDKMAKESNDKYLLNTLKDAVIIVVPKPIFPASSIISELFLASVITPRSRVRVSPLAPNVHQLETLFLA